MMGSEIIACLDKSISMIDGYLEKGMMYFSAQETMDCKTIAELGFRIQSGIPASDEVTGKLKKLDEKMKQLEDTSEVYLDDLEAFIAKNNISSGITNDIFNMKSLLTDCLTNPDEDSVENFRVEYEQHPPLLLAYTLWSIMRQKHANPLMIAVDADEPEKKAIIGKWEYILHAVLGDLLFIESFASGLLYEKDLYNCDRLIDKANEFFVMEVEEEEEEKEEDDIPDDEFTWDSLKRIFGQYISEQTEFSNAEKATKIASQLETINTNDSFYVFVFDECNLNNHMNLYCHNADTQIVAAWNTGKCNAIIYRSRSANFKTEADFQKLQNDVDACKKGKLRHPGFSFENIIKNQLVDKKLLQNNGFIILIDPKLNLAVASAKCAKNRGGPGGNATVEMKRGLLLLVSFDSYSLYAAFD